LTVTQGLSVRLSAREEIPGIGSTLAYVNAAMFFGEGIEPSMVQFKLKKTNGVWLINDALVSKKEMFIDEGEVQKK